ncbi:MAG: intermembrane transport protein PqiB [Parahaliea sp.]
MNEPLAQVSEQRRISLLWVLPVLVLIIGIGVTVQHYMSRGPVVEIAFDTAEGLEAGRTKVRALSVDVGLVDDIELADDLEGVIVRIQMAHGTERLLQDDTRFWVVRPRISSEGVSGLGTLLSGAYIELYPGEGGGSERYFEGLENAPPTPPGVAGVRIYLNGESASSVGVGSPVLYQGLQVGQVESVELDMEQSDVSVSLFIDSPYDQLVTEGARFWNASGMNVSAGADGIEVNTASLAALMAGGIAFAVPKDISSGKPVATGTHFRLFENQQLAQTDPYEFGKVYVMQFEQSLRGLSVGAPVEYRGIRVGTVTNIMQEELATNHGHAIAVSVMTRIEPGRFGMADSESSLKELDSMMRRGVAEAGLRGTLQTGSLVTGGLYVSLDNYPEAELAMVGIHDGYDTLPTHSTGITRLSQQVSELLAKLNALPLEQTTAELNQALRNASNTLTSIERLAKDDAMTGLPTRLDETLVTLEKTLASYSADSQLQQDIDKTLSGLETTLRGIDELVQLLKEQPNALVFPIDRESDLQPGSAQ